MYAYQEAGSCLTDMIEMTPSAWRCHVDFSRFRTLDVVDCLFMSVIDRQGCRQAIEKDDMLQDKT
jgi:hypothetical protein